MFRAATLALASVTFCLAAPMAQGQDRPPSSPLQARPASTDVTPPAAKAAVRPLSDTMLAGLRGGQTLIVGTQTMTAITTGNILNGDYAAGDVSLTDNALSNFTGVGNILINTGAQVSLQSGMNLIINTAP